MLARLVDSSSPAFQPIPGGRGARRVGTTAVQRFSRFEPFLPEFAVAVIGIHVVQGRKNMHTKCPALKWTEKAARIPRPAVARAAWAENTQSHDDSADGKGQQPIREMEPLFLGRSFNAYRLSVAALKDRIFFVCNHFHHCCSIRVLRVAQPAPGPP
ncbi:hypothetical protein [Azohydromonas australica]|uniref:hypothetical protein n=1 Tax=Azohydromonas australica TaxID=364039 RepID=UPI0012EC93AF|nr:hypothetical protein [Azohydromonas australica]